AHRRVHRRRVPGPQEESAEALSAHLRPWDRQGLLPRPHDLRGDDGTADAADAAASQWSISADRWLVTPDRYRRRGAALVVLLGAELQELDRARTPASPTGLAVSPAGEVFVSGELEAAVARYAPSGGRLVPMGTIPVDGVHSIRAMAYGPEGILHLVEDHDHRLLTISLTGEILDGADSPIGLGPRIVVRTAGYVVVNCVLSHEVV